MTAFPPDPKGGVTPGQMAFVVVITVLAIVCATIWAYFWARRRR